jgi:hypothetical protein
MLHEFANNFLHNLFKPLLLFFYAGFLIPILKVNFEFPKPVYQGLTMFLLLAIGWHGGEELASLEPGMIGQALGFMAVGFVTNTIIGIAAYGALRSFTKLRKVDAATVAAYYGSDSAGTFVTCLGVLTASNIAFAAYMPVMLAVMEIPGCLVALVIIAKLRATGMDPHGNMPGEPGYRQARGTTAIEAEFADEIPASGEEELVGAAAGEGSSYIAKNGSMHRPTRTLRAGHGGGHGGHGHDDGESDADSEEAVTAEDDIALRTPGESPLKPKKKRGVFSAELLHEVFFNPGIFLLFAGIAIGFISRLQGAKVTAAGDKLFNDLFQALLCLFLLEMGITASRKLKDLKAGGWQFVAFALIAPNVFAISGIFIAHAYSLAIGQPFEVGTYVVFAVLCGAASYIAVPAVQRMAIPEASPTLPLAASLGVTFSYNVTIGIPVYLLVAEMLVGKS